ncbi:MAG: ankyrin repeat domain-containing protein, partial [Pirellulaceae bacterium]|nr:ankyrin repeat domain-containing protein [Pirellulaceae bacterium]
NPLMIAAAGGESECLKELLKSGVDPRTADNGGQTPLDYATEHLEIWKSINADPSQIDIGVFESQEEVARRIREQLAQAEECVKLLGESLRTDR